MKEKLTMSIAECAAELGVCEKTVYTLSHRLDFPVVRIGRRIRISREGLKTWVQKQQQDNMGVSA